MSTAGSERSQTLQTLDFSYNIFMRSFDRVIISYLPSRL